LKSQGKINPPDPIDPQDAIAAAQEILPHLLKSDGVKIDQLLMGDELNALLDEVGTMDVKTLLEKAYADSRAYHQAWIAKSGKKK